MGAEGASLEVQQHRCWGVWGCLRVVGDSEPRPGQWDYAASLQARSKREAMVQAAPLSP